MQTYMHDVLEELPEESPKQRRTKLREHLILSLAIFLLLLQVLILVLVLSKPAKADDQRPKYVAWLMVMWTDGDVKKPYVPINAYKDYQVCVDTMPKMALALKFPKGAKVDCIDKHYQMTQVQK